MIVSRLILKNWRNFRSVDIPLTPRTIVMGPNGIGKSNLLDALRFLADISRPGGSLSNAMQLRGGLEKIKFAAAKKKDLVEMEIHLADSLLAGTLFRYSLGIAADQSGQAQLVYERVRRGGELILERPDKKDASDPARMGKTSLELLSSARDSLPGITVASRNDIKEIAGFLAAIGYLNFIPALFRRPRVKHLQDQLSDGALAGFAILWSFLEDDPVLILEKPEAFLNADTINRICLLPYMAFALVSRKQLIIITHSPEFLKDSFSGVDASEIILLTACGHKEGTKAFQASSLSLIADEMDSGASADEVIPFYAGPVDLMDELSDIMDLDIGE